MKHVVSENILILFGANSKLEWGRSYQLAKAFSSNGHNVVYVDLPKPINEYFKRSNTDQSLVSSLFEIYQPQFGLPYGKIRFLRPLNEKIIYTQLYDYLKGNNFVPTVLWIYSPYDPKIAQKLIDAFGIEKVVYDCADDRVAYAFAESGERGARVVDKLERDLCTFCGSVISITENLKIVKKHLHNNIYVVPNGVDCKMFDSNILHERPELFKSFNGKVILYAGTFGEWIDQDTIVKAAQSYPSFYFVFLGPVRVDVSRIKNLNNAHFLGTQDYRFMPAYMAHSDLCIMPFKDNDITKVCDSLKSLQYLAMERPVLSTWYSAVNDYFGLVHVAKSTDEFVDNIGILISEHVKPNREILNSLLQYYSWSNLAKEALNFVTSN